MSRCADCTLQRQVNGEKTDGFVPVGGREGEVQGGSGPFDYSIVCRASVREFREQDVDAGREKETECFVELLAIGGKIADF